MLVAGVGCRAALLLRVPRPLHARRCCRTRFAARRRTRQNCTFVDIVTGKGSVWENRRLGAAARDGGGWCRWWGCWCRRGRGGPYWRLALPPNHARAVVPGRIVREQDESTRGEIAVHSRCLHYLSVRVGLGGSVDSRTDWVTERLVVICRRVGIARVCVRVQYGYSVREGAGGRERERERE
jgi:hypothetical protein